jgi:shikimate dehydrogenase
MLNFQECINEIKKIKTKNYCLIIGGEGTNNARSPKIWNKILKKNRINCKMIPLEVRRSHLIALLNYLRKDTKFLGGSVTKPYKEDIFKFLGNNLDIFTKKIGSVNCLYKDKKLFGLNTDGIGFFETLKKNKVDKNLKNVLHLGYGGVGKAVLVFLRKYFSKKTTIYCATRKNFSKKIINTGCKWIQWNQMNKSLKNMNVIVNSTSLGFDKQNKKTPIILKEKNKLKLVYDVIYNPKTTILLKNSQKFGIKIINGLDMNMLQAFYAIKKVFKNKIKTT